MATTPQDWRVTAYQEAQRAISAYRRAHDEPAAGPDTPIPSAADSLASYWAAQAAAAAAVGALLEAELRAGMSWADVAAALGFADETAARAALAAYRSAGARRLRERLPDA